jgi:hypothetical protein
MNGAEKSFASALLSRMMVVSCYCPCKEESCVIFFVLFVGMVGKSVSER